MAVYEQVKSLSQVLHILTTVGTGYALVSTGTWLMGKKSSIFRRFKYLPTVDRCLLLLVLYRTLINRQQFLAKMRQSL